MKWLLSLLAVSGALWLTCSSTYANCGRIPIEIQQYLKVNPNWSIVDIKSLEKYNRVLWEKYHHGECPGFALFNVDGRRVPGYAVALLRYTKTKVFEKVVVVGNIPLSGSAISPAINVKTTDVPVISVIWRAAGGLYRDVITGRLVKINGDVIGYEEIGSGIVIYYFENGRYRTAQTAE